MTGTQIQKKNRGGDVGFPDEMPSKLEIPNPPVQIRALILLMLLAGLAFFGGIGTWAAFAPLRSAVVAGGSFEVDGNLQVVQHLEGGLVREINVREGDTVKVGQVIAVLDDTRVKSQIGILYSQLASALAREARLKAEFAQADEISFSQEFLDIVKEYPQFDEVLVAQTNLFNSNRTTDQGRIAILVDRLDQLEQQLVGAQQRNKSRKDQLALVSAEVEDLRVLLEKGLALRPRYTARRQAEAALIGEVGETESEIQAIYQQISESKERVLQVRRDRELAITDELQSLKEQIFSIRQRLDSAHELAGRQTIRAPVSGRIVGFELNTIGAVVQPGQTILQIVPADSTYIVEARVAPSDIDEVVVGSPARVRLSAYSYRSTPPVLGTVTYVSADSFYSTSAETSFYTVRVEVPDEQFDNLPNVQPVPSMPVQIMIATGEQTVLSYLLNPVLGGLETAMVETE